MLLVGTPCGPWAANCYLIAQGPGQPCLIIDPGMEAAEMVTDLVAQHQLTPVAICATHGHIDHVADAAALADRWDITLWIHSADRHLLTNPAAGLSADLTGWVHAVWPSGLAEPRRVATLDDRDHLDLAGVTLAITHSPGHSAGSVMFRLIDPDPDGPAADAHPIVVFTGDVLFAGSIGRTDLPGADPAQMVATLRGPVWDLPDAAHLLPGHGATTTMARERGSNPYLQPDWLAH
jgi:glyoxylase-like metal-dependent hydrolase (beta-lactamase superfamily II)